MTPHSPNDGDDWYKQSRYLEPVPEQRILNDWAKDVQVLVQTSHKRSLAAMEWYIQCELNGLATLNGCVEVDEFRRGGVPVLKGTGFTVAQMLAELAETNGPNEISEAFDLDIQVIKAVLNGLSLLVSKPMIK